MGTCKTEQQSVSAADRTKDHGARENMHIVIVGHVDHGKSTIIGRLLADTGSLPEGKLDQVKARCRRNSRPFEYAFLLDALKDEQAQGITIDSARCFFRTEKRNYIIIDAPGHIEFLKNMITGASRAEAALLVIDAEEGIQENSRRHGYMLSMLGVKQVAVLVNKMDLVGYSRDIFDKIVSEYTAFLTEIGLSPQAFIPVSGMEGDAVARPGANMPWYRGPSVLDILDSFKSAQPVNDLPFRMPVQDVYKFTRGGDKRRCIAGTIESGEVHVGDTVVFYPSGKSSIVKSLEVFNRKNPQKMEAGYAAAMTLEEQIFVARGEMAVLETQPRPQVTTRFKANIFWLGKAPLRTKKDYILKLGTARVGVQLEEILQVMNASNLKGLKKSHVGRHDVAECIFQTRSDMAFDRVSELAATSRFVLVDDYEIAGGGIILEALPDKQDEVREKVFLRNLKWQASPIPRMDRAAKHNQKPILILITGRKDCGKKPLAKALEKALFDDGRLAYFLGIGNVLYGVDADIKGEAHDLQENREEHLRRLAEVAHILLDAGFIFIVTAIDLQQEDIRLIQTAVGNDLIETVWIGKPATHISYDLHLPQQAEGKSVRTILKMLQDRGVIVRPE